MINSKSGFAAILLVVVLGVLVIGGGAWVAKEKFANRSAESGSPQDSSLEPADNPQSPGNQNSSPVAGSALADARVFNSPGLGVSFSYPSGWSATQQSADVVVVNNYSKEDQAERRVQINISHAGASVDLSSIAKSRGVEGALATSLGGATAVKGTIPGPGVGYVVNSGGKTYVITYRLVNVSDIAKDVDGIISSLKFTGGGNSSAATGVSGSLPLAPASLKTYSSAQLGASFQYPASWYVYGEGPGATVGPTEDTVHISIGGDVLFGCPEKDCLKELSEAVGVYKMIEDSPTTLGGHPAIKGRIPLAADSYVPAYVVRVDNKIYLVWYANISDPSERAIVESIVASIRFQ